MGETIRQAPTRRRLGRWLIAVVALLGVAYVGFSAYYAIQFTSPMPKPAGSFAEYLPSTTETVRFNATDGVPLSGWFVPQPGATRAAILLHGHGSNRRQMLARARLLHAHGYAVLLYDARGHGESGGDRISIGWFEKRDLLGALDYLRGRGFREFGLIGLSQGGATIALAASELRDIKWVTLESVYPTLRDAVDRRFRRMFALPGWLAGMLMIPMAEWRLGVSIDEVSPLAHVAELRCPIFFLQGEADLSTLPESARALYALAREPKSLWLVPGAAHVDMYGFAKAEYEKRLLEFIARATGEIPLATQ
jgi:fermentation-respiration switch protein FrsA (DUF1100 family)